MRRSALIGLAVVVGLFCGASLAPPITALGGQPPKTAPRVDTLKGSDAQEFVADLTLHNARFAWKQARSAIRHSAWGAVPDSHVIVFKVTSQQQVGSKRLLGQMAGIVFPRLFAQEVDVSDGYAIFSSYDNGNNSTWEGNVYVYDSTGDTDGSYDLELDISGNNGSGSDYPPTVLQSGGYIEGPLSNGPQEISDEEVGKMFGPVATAKLVALTGGTPSAMRTGCSCALMANAQGGMAKCMAHNAAANAWGWCAGAAVGCLFMGPGYPGCLAGGCIAAFVADFIGEQQDVYRRCSTGVPAHSPNGQVSHQ
jgi:hypothetical protein